MIKFFRKIRKSLLKEGKTSEYFKYAIGEIVLVVIGILIALQINNWNENRKSNVKLKTTLNSLYQELLIDSLEVSKIIPNVKREVSNNQKLLYKAYAKDTNLDTLIEMIQNEFSIYWVAHLNYNRNTFDNLKSSGTYEILPDSIKNALSDFYTTQDYWINVIEKTNIQYRNRFDDFTKTYHLVGINEIINKNAFVYTSSWETVDANHFIPRAISMLRAKNVLWKNFQQELEIMQSKTRTIVDLIKPYLDD